MKNSDAIRDAVIQACRKQVDSWTNGNADQIVLDALDRLPDEEKLALCLRYLPSDHVLYKTYKRTAPVIAPEEEAPRDYTPLSEGRGT